MDDIQTAHVKQSLLAAQTAIQDALATLGGATPERAGTVYLPSGNASCSHPKRIVAMGGHWTCPDCGVQGREESI